ncbi:hypothetical protein XENTR_v10010923 [Xenopus tropicalis]|uniref:Tetraspanin-32 n=1 Tax=Xenopus tropicalis TaxID=8364 RepID=A0A6I8QIK7_XENTR|nr:tetraspanin-32 [Xenopus tropicalis]KAE8606909.1 hypothetical protein XENTR_v10010923 [Xenopus tropicalis]|eukprot:XP_002938949.2 PREDICTED: tetraspanin-32 [Xenopus tropicalis]
MEQQVWVRLAKSLLLVSCLFMMLLCLAAGILTVMTGLGGHFSAIKAIAPPESPLRGKHSAMVLYGSGVSALLLILVLLSSISVLRESRHLMTSAFLGFGCLFCILTVGATWIQASQQQVDTSLLDVYDELYEQVLRESLLVQREQLQSMHETLQCCGKLRDSLPRTDMQGLCKNVEERQDCVVVISKALQTHWTLAQVGILVSLGFMVQGMFLSSFLFFSLPRGANWVRRGEYSLKNASVLNPDTPLARLLPHQTAESKRG